MRKLRFSGDLRQSFALVFKRWRKKHRIPLKQLATDLKVSIGTVNKWELGHRFPTSRHFTMLCEYAGEPPCHLLCVMATKCRRSRCMLFVRST